MVTVQPSGIECTELDLGLDLHQRQCASNFKLMAGLFINGSWVVPQHQNQYPIEGDILDPIPDLCSSATLVMVKSFSCLKLCLRTRCQED